jgi:two-component system sensor histidine kinase/response regulator
MKQNRILIVGDNATNVAILEEILGDHYRLATAASGEEALRKASEFRPELILLDIMMPGTNGYEACRKIRANAALRHSKIIMVSAKAMVAERIEGYDAGADDYITKPFDEDELLAKVRIYLRLSYLEEVDKLKSEVLMLLNHETRPPLNNIIPVIEMLLDEGPMEHADGHSQARGPSARATRQGHSPQRDEK